MYIEEREREENKIEGQRQEEACDEKKAERETQRDTHGA